MLVALETTVIGWVARTVNADGFEFEEYGKPVPSLGVSTLEKVVKFCPQHCDPFAADVWQTVGPTLSAIGSELAKARVASFALLAANGPTCPKEESPQQRVEVPE